MNLVILQTEDLQANNSTVLTDYRHLHIRKIHKAQLGQKLKVGLLNGLIGTAEVIELNEDNTLLDNIELTKPAPASLPLILIMAVPRPKMLKRCLQTIASMGVSQLYLINSYRVDKSYWSSPKLNMDQIKQQLILGLEQAGSTQLPEVHLRKAFKPFVEDELPDLSAKRRNLVAHPYQAKPCPAATNEPSCLVLGPEGGFIQYEIEKLQEAGFQTVHLGERILRLENALPVAITRLFAV